MARSGCSGRDCVKLLLIIILILLLVRGGTLIAVGVWTILDNFAYAYLLMSVTYIVLVYFTCAVGGLIVISTIIGLIGAHNGHKISLVIFIFFIALSFLANVMLSVSFYIFRENIQTELELNLNTTMLSRYKFDDQVTTGVDSLQRNFKCCGSESFSDWKYSAWLKEDNTTENKVPDSCCKTYKESCGRRDHPSNINYADCRKRMETHMKFHLLVHCITSCCMIEILGIIYACWFYFKLRSEKLDISETKPLHSERSF